ncbi:dihydroxyacetone kinase family protein [Leifsonia poae]|uniref:dihydroxyacetone kinase family protein n=1 Tax=Leifsonia poae TaxID=110933 RepID=UPI001CBC2612|nr:dihydroxyacetone kinase family protein [Leifsonia poae]
MTRLFNEPAAFADEMVAGFVAANRSYVRPVSGGVVRRSPADPGSVSVVIGGGSGHYPAFGGLVGPGLAHGAALGNLFASPSARAVHSVASEVAGEGGVLLTYGNYAGDVLNFDAAQEQLRAEGIACETVTVTDDISSAPSTEREKRRGIAGDLTVFKVAAAAADAGYPLSEVARVARLANEGTRSFGVAFTGCTLPGAQEPLFSVPGGRMAVGMGIHGEPGIDEADIPSAAELATLLVSSLLAELPDGMDSVAGRRVVPLLNGLGSVKYEELFVVFGTVARLLDEAGVVTVDPQVGEFCTSFDMAGVSLTLFWLDPELETLWSAACDSPAFKRGSRDDLRIAPAGSEAAAPRAVVAEPEPAPDPEPEPADPASIEAAARIVHLLEVVCATIDENADELGRIDAVAGDGDHGIGMQRGVHAALDAARSAAEGSGAGSVLTRAAHAWADRAGGTSGALWGVALRRLGETIGDAAAPTAATVSAGVTAAVDGVVGYGKASLGDKTMVDAMLPFRDALASHIAAGLPSAWNIAADVAVAAAAATADLLPRLGRARPHALKSVGTPDAGAQSFALIVSAIARHLSTGKG